MQCKNKVIEVFSDLPPAPNKRHPEEVVSWSNDKSICELRENLKHPRLNGVEEKWLKVVYGALNIGSRNAKDLMKKTGIEAFVQFAVLEYLHGRPQIDKNNKINHERWFQCAYDVKKDITKYKKKVGEAAADHSSPYEAHDTFMNPDDIVIASSDEEQEDQSMLSKIQENAENEFLNVEAA